MSDIPSTDVIRHWIAWTYTADTPEEYIDHDNTRLQLFNEWLETVRGGWYTQGVLDGRDYERKLAEANNEKPK